MTGAALLHPVYTNLLLAAEGGLLKGNGQVGPQALPLLGTVAPLTAAAKATEAAAAKEGPNDVTQVDVPHVKAAEAAAGTACAVVGVHPRMTELVVPGTLLLVGQDAVRLVHFLELGLGLLVSGVHVGVIFFGQFPVGLFDLIIGGAFAHAQHLVIITFLFWHMVHQLYKLGMRS